MAVFLGVSYLVNWLLVSWLVKSTADLVVCNAIKISTSCLTVNTGIVQNTTKLNEYITVNLDKLCYEVFP